MLTVVEVAYSLEVFAGPGINPFVVGLLEVSRKQSLGRGWGVRETLRGIWAIINYQPEKQHFNVLISYDYTNAYWIKICPDYTYLLRQTSEMRSVRGIVRQMDYSMASVLRFLRSQMKSLGDQRIFLFYLEGCSVKLQMLSRHLHSDSGQREGTDHLFPPPLQNSWTDLLFQQEISTCRLFEYWCLIDKVIQTQGPQPDSICEQDLC